MPKLTGEISAQFAVRSGLTRLVHKYHTSPLKIAKTFRYENETCMEDAAPYGSIGRLYDGLLAWDSCREIITKLTCALERAHVFF